MPFPRPLKDNKLLTGISIWLTNSIFRHLTISPLCFSLIMLLHYLKWWKGIEFDSKRLSGTVEFTSPNMVKQLSKSLFC